MDTFGDWVKKWVLSLFGADLMAAAIEEGRPIPVQAWVNLAYSCITLVLGLFLAYRLLYLVLGLFGRSRKYPSAPTTNRYCFLLPARNEELVIANLIDSIRSMDYPQAMIDILVVADNCDEEDQTAEIARGKGAFVVERHDPEHRTKGFALQYALKEFGKTHHLENDYYAYIVMDADNVVATDFLRKLNDCMVHGGFDECVAYRNAKNLPESWISAMCGMNVYVNVLIGQRARSILNTNQQVYGTSCCLRSHLLKDGWRWTGLTEDLELQTDLSAQGYRLGYCEEAVFYEEEPTKANLFIRQQMRWSRGNIMAFGRYAWPLIKSFFKKPTWGKYDMFWQAFPLLLFNFYFALTYQIASLILFFALGDQGYSWTSFFVWIGTMLGTIYVSNLINDVLTIIREWKRFHLSLPKTLLYILLFPLYHLINLPISAVAAFMNVTWKRIDHHTVVDPKDLEAEELLKQGKK